MTMDSLTTLTDFYNTITKISLTLIKYQFENVDTGVNKSLEIMGRYANVERAYIFSFDHENNCCSNTYEWCAEGVEPEIDNLQNVPINLLSCWIDEFEKNLPMYIPDISKMPEGQEKEILQAQSIKSLIALPIFHNKQLLGFIGFDAVHKHRKWDAEHRMLMRLSSNIISSILSNQRYREELISKNKALEEALKNVKMLQGLLPICSNCKKIRDDKGHWHDVAEYVHEHSEAEFSHGICPDCGKKLYPGMDDVFGK